MNCPQCGLPIQIIMGEQLCSLCGALSLMGKLYERTIRIKEQILKRKEFGTKYLNVVCGYILVPIVFLEMAIIHAIYPTLAGVHPAVSLSMFFTIIVMTCGGAIYTEMKWRGHHPGL